MLVNKENDDLLKFDGNFSYLKLTELDKNTRNKLLKGMTIEDDQNVFKQFPISSYFQTVFGAVKLRVRRTNY